MLLTPYRMKKVIRVIHADDHVIVRYGFKRVFEADAPHIHVVGEAASYPELYSVLRSTPADILLLDGIIIGGSTSVNLPVIRYQYPHLKIILLWLFADEHSLTQWIHLLDGHLPMGCTDKKDIIHAITAIMSGEKYLVMPVYKVHKERLGL